MSISRQFMVLTHSILAILLISCSAEHKKGLDASQTFADPNGKSIDVLLEQPTQIVFEDINTRIIQPKCMNCHSSTNRKDNVDLSSYEALVGKTGAKIVVSATQPENSKLFDVTQQPPSSSRHMPPLNSGKSPLDEQEKQLLYAWIKEGAKKTVAQSVEIPPSLKEQLSPYFSKPETIDYNVVNKHVFAHACNTCHSQNGEQAQEHSTAWQLGIDMTSYKSLTDDETNALFGLEPGLVKGLPAKSRIYIESAVNQSMPPRKSYDPLNAFRVKLLRLWILNCAIEDYGTTQATGDTLLGKVRPGAEKVRDCNPSKSESQQGVSSIETL